MTVIDNAIHTYRASGSVNREISCSAILNAAW